MRVENISRVEGIGTQVVISIRKGMDETLDPNSPRWRTTAKILKRDYNIEGEFVGVDIQPVSFLIQVQFSFKEKES